MQDDKASYFTKFCCSQADSSGRQSDTSHSLGSPKNIKQLTVGGYDIDLYTDV